MRAGHYDDALALLFAEMPGLGVRGADETMSWRENVLWQRAILAVHCTRADRAGLHDVVDHIARICPPAPPMAGAGPGCLPSLGPAGRPSHEVDGADAATTELSAVGEVEALIHRARKLKNLNAAASAMEPILRALSLTASDAPPMDPSDAVPATGATPTSGQGLRRLHLLAIVVLADIEVDFGAFGKAAEELERIWPAVLTDPDVEFVAYARHTLARALIGRSNRESRDVLIRVVDLLHEAANCACALAQPVRQH